MKRLLVTAALGATIISTQAFAQQGAAGDRGGSMQQDMTRQQAQQMANSMFQRFDTNHDGTVTREEAEQAISQFGGGERAQRMLDRAVRRRAVGHSPAVRDPVACPLRPRRFSTMMER